MLKTDNCFISFKGSIKSYSLPKRFTFPFYYEAHPLCILAIKELQHYLSTQTKWQHNFGLNANEDKANGKMFGVLLVENEHKEIGYLTAFSGKFCGTYTLGKFVPPLCEQEETKSIIQEQEQAFINKLTQQIRALENDPNLQKEKTSLNTYIDVFKIELNKYQEVMATNRKKRKDQRLQAEKTLNDDALSVTLKTLAKESVKDKNQLKVLKQYWQIKINKAQLQFDELSNKISLLISERYSRSSVLQDQIFQQYQPLNKQGDTKALQDIFKTTSQQTPPAGAGDCAAPKLIQYAFKNNLKILAMAEFWWGASPKSEIRQHKNYYPACSGKCEPILNWMLEGIALDENPLLINTADKKHLKILYRDDVMAIVNKPHEMLSVPGKHIQDSVYNRIKQLIPSASGPIIVHRLDMSTSGLMVIALTKRAHKQLQKQFIQKTVDKRYVAILDGIIKKENGEITLPLMGDFYNRPRQLVCEKSGKLAHTTWQVIEYTSANKTKVHLTPKTGRTHQLRVHCAHPSGLNTPIVGDDLYGVKADRLYLHAEKITLQHPITKTEMIFQSPSEF